MTLSSPNYPKLYNDGVGCEWLISAPEGYIIALVFNDFHVSILLNFVIVGVSATKKLSDEKIPAQDFGPNTYTHYNVNSQ